MVKRKSPKAARDANPQNAHRAAIRKRNKTLEVPKGKEPVIVRMKYPGQKSPKIVRGE
jgi:hypothetical protein